MNPPDLLQLHPADNVVVALRTLEPGERLTLPGGHCQLAQRVPVGFKLAAQPIAAGDKVRKYGAPIGSATRAIAPGEMVHLHNLRSDYLPTQTRPSELRSHASH